MEAVRSALLDHSMCSEYLFPASKTYEQTVLGNFQEAAQGATELEIFTIVVAEDDLRKKFSLQSSCPVVHIIVSKPNFDSFFNVIRNPVDGRKLLTINTDSIIQMDPRVSDPRPCILLIFSVDTRYYIFPSKLEFVHTLT